MSVLGAALDNHIALTEVFKNLDFQDVLNFRLVNKQWMEIANSVIIQKRLGKLHIDSNGPFKKRYNNQTLADLNDCIEESVAFPCTTLVLSTTDNSNATELDRFYDVFGDCIKVLKLKSFRADGVKDLQELLIEKVPKVESIDIGNIQLHQNDNNPRLFSDSTAKIVLPYLKKIKFTTPEDSAFPQDLFKDFLAAAVNLKEIQEFRQQMAQSVIEAGRIDCIKEMYLCETRSRAAMDRYEVFPDQKLLPSTFSYSQFPVKLTFLDIRRFRLFREKHTPKFVEGLNWILVSSKDTLKRLRTPSFYFMPGVVLPKFEKLEHLEIYDDPALYIDSHRSDFRYPKFFPDDCGSMGEIFPKLHTINYNLVCDSGTDCDIINQYFPDELVFSTVKKIKFDYCYYTAQALYKVFPNATQIEIMNGALNSYGNVELEMELDLGNQVESLKLHWISIEAANYSLDSVFTGLPVDFCKELHQRINSKSDNFPGQLSDEELQELKSKRTSEPFSNANGLKRIKMVLDNTAVISPVTYVYALALLPNLKEVVFLYDHHNSKFSNEVAKALEPLTAFPNISVVHESYPVEDRLRRLPS